MWWYILICNAFAALLCLLYNIKKKRTSKGIVIALIIIICPVITPCFFLLSGVTGILIKKLGRFEINLEELSFRKDRVIAISAADIKKDSNKVSLEEAMLVSDKEDKRNAFLDLLKQDSESSFSTIKEALESDDSEISHYAAASITDAIAKFKIREKKRQEDCRQLKTEESFLDYIEDITSFLLYDVLSPPEQKAYLTRLEKYMDIMRLTYPQALNGTIFSRFITLLERQGDLDKTEKWIETALTLCVDDLDVYKTGLKFYYANRRKENFFNLMQYIKVSGMVLDSEAVDWMRFFG